MHSILRLPSARGRLLRLLTIASLGPVALLAAFPEPHNTQVETIPFVKAAEALGSVRLPEGFQATLFAFEPQVRNPIAMTTDARGRLWVAENFTYAERGVGFDPNLRDRIIILEDTDGDGQADKRTVFWDRGQRLASVELGFGGVFVLCAPRLLFIPDRDGDDQPDAEPEVLLDGWNDGSVQHNVVNGLKWGPDGWLYGRHGILGNSYVGKPGTPPEERIRLNCVIWRYHPVRRTFEIVAEGTTNSWGHDWDEHGELFFINTVIGHLWHCVPGAYYQRMYGEHFHPHLYELIGQTADHFHWDTKESWDDIRKLGVTSTTSVAGGGHAHSGMMIYQGGNWPAPYRGGVFTINFHGRRLNWDRLERQGAGFVARHAQDLVFWDDPWFRGVELMYGRDGGVFVLDWSDIGECHDNDGVHRTSGRIYKIIYGPSQPAPGPAPPSQDLSNLDSAGLVELQRHSNEWFARQARRILHERAVAGADLAPAHSALRKLFQSQTSVVHQLRALWALWISGGADDAFLRSLLRHDQEQVRAWAVRLLVDRGTPSAEVIADLERLARSESSGRVHLYLASALPRLPAEQRWPLAEVLASATPFAEDAMLPLLIWYGLEPVVLGFPEEALGLVQATSMPRLRRFIARRLTGAIAENARPVEHMLKLAAQDDGAFQREVLTGMTEALRGWRKAPVPKGWAATSVQFASSEDESVRRMARELAVVFGDGRALEELRELALDAKGELEARRSALRSLVQTRADRLAPVLHALLRERDLAPDAVRGLAAFDSPDTPRIILEAYNRFYTPAKAESLVTLSSRPGYARELLQAVKRGVVRRDEVPAFQRRQMQSFRDAETDALLAEIWPETAQATALTRQRVAEWKSRLTPPALAKADRSRGRALFSTACASCHRLFDAGGGAGPDLTGADRKNLDYLLENILDPSATVAEDFRVSIVALEDGRVLNGVVANRTERTLTLQAAAETLTLERAAVKSMTTSELSLMPEGLLDAFDEGQVLDLIAYLTSGGQVPLPREGRK